MYISLILEGIIPFICERITTLLLLNYKYTFYQMTIIFHICSYIFHFRSYILDRACVYKLIRPESINFVQNLIDNNMKSRHFEYNKKSKRIALFPSHFDVIGSGVIEIEQSFMKI